METVQFRLSDGRLLKADLYGPPAKKAILFFHGLGSSKAIVQADEAWLWAQQIRLLVPNRPGIGTSGIYIGYNLFDVARDTQELMKSQGITHVYPLGWSAGAAYAMAYSLAFPEMVQKTGLISPCLPFGEAYKKILPPTWLWAGWINKNIPWLARLYFRRLAAKIARHPEKVLDAATKNNSTPDQLLVEQIHWRIHLLQDMQQAYCHHGLGVFADAQAICKTWYDPAAIRTPVLIWQGQHDSVWTTETAQALQAAIPNARLKLYPRQGHLLFLTHWSGILTELLFSNPFMKN
jgi:pimeloyl-ACP methyl ester carboxylesterase